MRSDYFADDIHCFQDQYFIRCVSLQAYLGQLPISKAKKADLMELLRSGVIPASFGAYYEALPSLEAVRDVLPDSDIDDYDE